MGAGARQERSRVRHDLAVLVVATALAACDAPPARRADAALYIGTDSMGSEPSNVRAIPVRARRELVENSAAAMSRGQPGVLFTVNDSRNAPVLFALDSTGGDRGAWKIDNARNLDWEAVAPGSCPGEPGHEAASYGCLYIGDVGDNNGRRASGMIYRVREPEAQGAGFVGHLVASALAFKYPDRPHDVEAMYVGRDATVFLITKRPLQDPLGRFRGALVFAIPPDAWQRDTLVTATLTDSLPIIPGSAWLRLITDAALSPNAKDVAVRTYAQVYVFAADSMTGRMLTATPPSVCNVVSLGERQGEGITWLDDRRLLLTSEGRHEPMHLISCPLPGGK